VLLVTKAGFLSSSSVDTLRLSGLAALAGDSGKAGVDRYIGKLLNLGSYQSGQLGLTVNQLRNASGVRISHCPPKNPARVAQR
jgi:hypothetical protein